MNNKYYYVDEFVRKCQPDDLDTVIDKKINLLKDFCILKLHDKREYALRKALAQCKSEYEITAALHDIIIGNKTLNEYLTQKGVH